MRTVLSMRLPEPLAVEISGLATATGRSKSDIVKESLSLYLWEGRVHGLRRHPLRRAKRPGVTAEADLFRAV